MILKTEDATSIIVTAFVVFFGLVMLVVAVWICGAPHTYEPT